MTEEELIEAAEKLSSDFKTLECLKEYRLLKKSVEEDENLRSLSRQVDELKKEARRDPRNRTSLLEKAGELDRLYKEDPKVVNLSAKKEELDYLLSPLTESKL